jgi:hypothetical protein
MTLAWIIILVVLAAVLAWNFVPAIRDKMRGVSTVAEAGIGGLLYVTNIAGEAIREAQSAGFIPDGIEYWVPYIVLAYIVAKRFQTRSSVGKNV